MPPFPTTPILDDANRADGDPGANYDGPCFAVASKLTIVSNQFTSAGSGNGASGWTTPVGQSCEVFCTTGTLSAAGAVSAIVYRLSSLTSATPTGYSVRALNDDTILIRRHNNDGSSTTIATFDQPFAAGDSLGMVIAVTKITAYYKSGAGAWSSPGFVLDTTYPDAGYLAWLAPDNTVRFDNVGGGTLGAELARAQLRVVYLRPPN